MFAHHFTTADGLHSVLVHRGEGNTVTLLSTKGRLNEAKKELLDHSAENVADRLKPITAGNFSYLMHNADHSDSPVVTKILRQAQEENAVHIANNALRVSGASAAVVGGGLLGKAIHSNLTRKALARASATQAATRNKHLAYAGAGALGLGGLGFLGARGRTDN